MAKHRCPLLNPASVYTPAPPVCAVDDNSVHLCLCLRLRKDEDTLSISGVNEGDEGTYTCTVRSEIDRDSAWARLTVLGTLSWEQCLHASGWKNACVLKLSPSLHSAAQPLLLPRGPGKS